MFVVVLAATRIDSTAAVHVLAAVDEEGSGTRVIYVKIRVSGMKL